LAAILEPESALPGFQKNRLNKADLDFCSDFHLVRFLKKKWLLGIG